MKHILFQKCSLTLLKNRYYQICYGKKSGITQASLKRNQRLTNQKGTFMIRQATLVYNKHVLIVDDIYTTGSTVNECARILKEHGAQSVTVFALVRTI
ncbi:ComF family protein [Candidatus Omnitrophota bacterium]